MEDRPHEMDGLQAVLAGGERRGVEPVVVDDAANVGPRLENLQMYRILSRDIASAGEFPALLIEHQQVVRGCLGAQRMARKQKPVGVGEPGADMAETFYEPPPVKEAPGFERVTYQ